MAKKKQKTATVLVTEEESEEEEMVHSSNEPVECSEQEDDEITIQPQHARLATRVGFNWETSDSVTVNHSSSDSSDESELMDDNEVKRTEHTCTGACMRTHAHTHAIHAHALHRFVMMIHFGADSNYKAIVLFVT